MRNKLIVKVFVLRKKKRQEDHELEGYSVRGKFNILLTRKRALTEG